MKRTYIIAEAGVNHNGSLKVAFKLIDKAKEACADAIKFQSFKTDKLVTQTAKKADYQKKNNRAGETQYEMIKKLELGTEEHIKLLKYCRKKRIEFISSPFDNDSVELLRKLKVKILKIPSGEITNLPFLRKIAKTNSKLILSTGMADLGEIEDAINVLTENGMRRDNITVLHCNTEYPTPYRDVNLKAMLTIKEAFKIKVGYSDHTRGIEIPIAAAALGAHVIEKHFTLDRNMEGPDHKASLEPEELKMMVESVRNTDIALGTGFKRCSKSERKNINIARKSLVAISDIKKGVIFSDKNIGVKRPGNGISPMRWDEIIGRKASRDYQTDDQLELYI